MADRVIDHVTLPDTVPTGLTALLVHHNIQLLGECICESESGQDGGHTIDNCGLECGYATSNEDPENIRQWCITEGAWWLWK